MTEALIELALTNKYFLYFILTCFLIETTLGVNLFIKEFFRYKKDSYSFFFPKVVSVFYFLFLNTSMIIDLFFRKVPYQNFSYLVWFGSVSLLSFGLYKFVDKFQVTKSRRKWKKLRNFLFYQALEIRTETGRKREI